MSFEIYPDSTVSPYLVAVCDQSKRVQLIVAAAEVMPGGYRLDYGYSVVVDERTLLRLRQKLRVPRGQLFTPGAVAVTAQRIEQERALASQAYGIIRSASTVMPSPDVAMQQERPAGAVLADRLREEAGPEAVAALDLERAAPLRMAQRTRRQRSRRRR